MAKPTHLQMVGARDADAPEEDFYPIPPIAVESLLRVESFDGPIWEPACGDGAISKVLEAAGHKVISTDLHDRRFGMPGIDLLMCTKPYAPNIVTNPPYSISTEFARQALTLCPAGKVCLLMRLAWLEGIERKALFEETGLARAHVFSRRLPRMHRHGWTGPRSTSTIAFAWFVWEPGWDRKTELDWI
jgi:hypothetical protein